MVAGLRWSFPTIAFLATTIRAGLILASIVLYVLRAPSSAEVAASFSPAMLMALVPAVFLLVLATACKAWHLGWRRWARPVLLFVSSLWLGAAMLNVINVLLFLSLDLSYLMLSVLLTLAAPTLMTLGWALVDGSPAGTLHAKSGSEPPPVSQEDLR